MGFMSAARFYSDVPNRPVPGAGEETGDNEPFAFGEVMVASLKMSQSDYSSAPLVMTDASASTGGAERRVFPRKEVAARIQGRRMDHTIPARREPFLNLSLRDLSMGGLSAISQSPVQRGERVSVFFPPQGVQRGWDALGRVIRCDASGFGYRIAVEFDPIPMAA